jgi:hypothetical protein
MLTDLLQNDSIFPGEYPRNYEQLRGHYEMRVIGSRDKGLLREPVYNFVCNVDVGEGSE